MFRKTLLASVAIAAVATAAFAGTAKKDIVDTAVSAGSFETLVAAVQAAGLPEGTVESLLLPENKDQLTAILTYHVVPGKVMSTDLQDDMEATTVQGDAVTIDLDDGVKVNEVNVVSADIETSNGVIHVIDKVILPETSS